MYQASFSPRIQNKREKGSPGHRLIWGLSICAYWVEGDASNYIWRGGGGLMQKKGSPQYFDQISGVLHRCLSYTSLSFRGTTFSIVEDTQLLLSEKKEGIYAYVSQHVVFVIFIPLF